MLAASADAGHPEISRLRSRFAPRSLACSPPYLPADTKCFIQRVQRRGQDPALHGASACVSTGVKIKLADPNTGASSKASPLWGSCRPQATDEGSPRPSRPPLRPQTPHNPPRAVSAAPTRREAHFTCQRQISLVRRTNFTSPKAIFHCAACRSSVCLRTVQWTVRRQ